MPSLRRYGDCGRYRQAAGVTTAQIDAAVAGLFTDEAEALVNTSAASHAVADSGRHRGAAGAPLRGTLQRAMRLERHVGGLSLARKVAYLVETGWTQEGGAWRASAPDAEPCPLARAVHHQLTADLCRELAPFGWSVGGYSARGYARLFDSLDGSSCSLPAALRREARRRQVPVRELTYSLFLAARLRPRSPPG